MKAVVTCCAGADIAKNFINVCLMTGAADKEPDFELRKFATFNADLLRLRDWLVEAGCSQFAMESTGSYWKPIYAVLEDSGIEVIVANGEDVKARRGHKTDWADCRFLANLRGTVWCAPALSPRRRFAICGT
jgi:transposase